MSLPPTRHDLTQGQKPEGRLKWGWRGGEGRERAETRTLLVIDPLSAMWIWWVKPYHGPKSRSGHVCQHIAWTRPWGLVLYKACKRIWKSSSLTRRLPSRSWGPIRPRVCSWFRAPIRHECQTAQPKGRGVAQEVRGRIPTVNSRIRLKRRVAFLRSL